MKKAAFLSGAMLLLSICTMPVAQAGQGIDKANCTYNGVPLYGNVKVVTSFADFDVQVVSSFADLHVRPDSAFASACGEWKFVENFPDFTVRYVNSFPDFTIKFVTSFPGMN